MAKKRKPQTLNDARRLYRLLLWNASNGNLGTEPEKTLSNEGITFAEKRGLLDSIIKIAQMEAKSAGNEEEPSGLELIKRNLNADRADWSPRNHGGSEGGSDEFAGSSESDGDSA